MNDLTNISQTLTTLALNADGVNLDYTDENGVTSQVNLGTLVAAQETLTSLVDSGNGTLTYNDEDGNSTNIDLTAAVGSLETLTALTLNADGVNLDYTDENGVTTQINLGTLVAAQETLTVIAQDATAGTITYTDEAGTDTVLDINMLIGNAETLTILNVAPNDGPDGIAGTNDDFQELTYRDEDGTVNSFDLTSALSSSLDGEGILANTATNELDVQAGNGLTVNATNDQVELGGALGAATTITTTAAETLSIAGLQAGAATDNIVVADPASGELQTITPAALAAGQSSSLDGEGILANTATNELDVQAGNGLTVNATNDQVELGGALGAATTITTTAAETLSIAGLQAGAATDNIVVADPASGELQTITPAALAAGQSSSLDGEGILANTATNELDVQAGNGLTVNATNDQVELGGALGAATTITTTAAETLSIAGLQAGAATDNIVVADPASGELQTITPAALAAGQSSSLDGEGILANTATNELDVQAGNGLTVNATNDQVELGGALGAATTITTTAAETLSIAGLQAGAATDNIVVADPASGELQTITPAALAAGQSSSLDGEGILANTATNELDVQAGNGLTVNATNDQVELGGALGAATTITTTAAETLSIAGLQAGAATDNIVVADPASGELQTITPAALAAGQSSSLDGEGILANTATNELDVQAGNGLTVNATNDQVELGGALGAATTITTTAAETLSIAGLQAGAATDNIVVADPASGELQTITPAALAAGQSSSLDGEGILANTATNELDVQAGNGLTVNATNDQVELGGALGAATTITTTAAETLSIAGLQAGAATDNIVVADPASGELQTITPAALAAGQSSSLDGEGILANTATNELDVQAGNGLTVNATNDQVELGGALGAATTITTTAAETLSIAGLQAGAATDNIVVADPASGELQTITPAALAAGQSSSLDGEGILANTATNELDVQAGNGLTVNATNDQVELGGALGAATTITTTAAETLSIAGLQAGAATDNIVVADPASGELQTITPAALAAGQSSSLDGEGILANTATNELDVQAGNGLTVNATNDQVELGGALGAATTITTTAAETLSIAGLQAGAATDNIVVADPASGELQTITPAALAAGQSSSLDGEGILANTATNELDVQAGNGLTVNATNDQVELGGALGAATTITTTAAETLSIAGLQAGAATDNIVVADPASGELQTITPAALAAGQSSSLDGEGILANTATNELDVQAGNGLTVNATNDQVELGGALGAATTITTTAAETLSIAGLQAGAATDNIVVADPASGELQTITPAALAAGQSSSLDGEGILANTATNELDVQAGNGLTVNATNDQVELGGALGAATTITTTAAETLSIAGLQAGAATDNIVVADPASGELQTITPAALAAGQSSSLDGEGILANTATNELDVQAGNGLTVNATNDQVELGGALGAATTITTTAAETLSIAGLQAGAATDNIVVADPASGELQTITPAALAAGQSSSLDGEGILANTATNELDVQAGNGLTVNATNDQVELGGALGAATTITTTAAETLSIAGLQAGAATDNIVVADPASGELQTITPAALAAGQSSSLDGEGILANTTTNELDVQAGNGLTVNATNDQVELGGALGAATTITTTAAETLSIAGLQAGAATDNIVVADPASGELQTITPAALAAGQSSSLDGEGILANTTTNELDVQAGNGLTVNATNDQVELGGALGAATTITTTAAETLSIAGLQAGAATDNIVVADPASGELQTITPAALAAGQSSSLDGEGILANTTTNELDVQAGNGLTVNATNDQVELGGALGAATTITTTAAETLSIAGLQAGAATDNIVVADPASGELQTITPAALAAGQSSSLDGEGILANTTTNELDVQAGNGLTVNATNDQVELGGALGAATTITTTAAETLSIAGLQAGAATDNIVVADPASGELQTITPAALAAGQSSSLDGEGILANTTTNELDVQAGNGLTVNATNDQVELGGALGAATTITTTAAETLSIAGLQAGAATDNIVVADPASGELQTITPAALAAGQSSSLDGEGILANTTTNELDVQAGNGLTVNATNDQVELGGALGAATTITTTAAETLSIAGLQAGAATDNIVVADPASGELQTITPAALAAGQSSSLDGEGILANTTTNELDVQAGNGLTVNATNDQVELGGALGAATTITTTAAETLSIAGLQAGAATDNIVVADPASGELQTITPAALAAGQSSSLDGEGILANTTTNELDVQAGNGLTVNATNDQVELGGALGAATTITTTAAETLSIAGLQAGAATDNIVVADPASGELQTITPAALAAGQSSSLDGEGILANTTTNELDVQAGNGLTVNATNDQVELGGALGAATTITTTAAETLSIAGLQAGAATDNIVVADPASGELQTITPAALAAGQSSSLDGEGILANTTTNELDVQAGNGLTVNATNDQVELGGALGAATTITTTAAETLSIAGLQAGAATDNIVVADPASGELQTITPAALAAGQSSSLDGEGILANTTTNELDVQAGNGLTVNATNDQVELGGALGAATTITASGTNTLTIATTAAEDNLLITNLQNTGTTTDNVLVVDAAGVVKTISQPTDNTLVFSAEYAGAVLFADGTDNLGMMTSDNTGPSGNYMNYYEWSSGEATEQDYDVIFRFTLPNDFTAWDATNPIVIDYQAEGQTGFGATMLLEDGTLLGDIPATSSAIWTTANVNLQGPGVNMSAGDTAVIILTLTSAPNDDTQKVRIGDITLNYRK